jgi:tetratricopeptide (TPR) repeat protein
VYWGKYEPLGQGFYWLDSMMKILDGVLANNSRSSEAHRYKHAYYWFAASASLKAGDTTGLFDLYVKQAKIELDLASEVSPHRYMDGDRAVIYQLEDKFDSALFFIKKAIKSGPNDKYAAAKAASYYHIFGEFELAENYYLELLKKQPDDVGHLEGLTRIYTSTKNYSELQKYSKDLFELNSYKGWEAHARSFILSNRLDESEALLAFELSKGYRLYVKLYYAYVLQQQGKKDKSKGLTDEIFDGVRRYTGSRESLDFSLDMASLYAISGDKEKSIQNILKANNVHWSRTYLRIQTYPWFEDILLDIRIAGLMNDSKKKLQEMYANFVKMEVSDEIRMIQNR